MTKHIIKISITTDNVKTFNFAKLNLISDLIQIFDHTAVIDIKTEMSGQDELLAIQDEWVARGCPTEMPEDLQKRLDEL